MQATKWRFVFGTSLVVMAARSADACTPPFALERYDVEDLRISDIERNPHSRAFALWIADPGDHVHSVSLGERLGKDSGRVDRITSCRIFFSEVKLDAKGGWIEVKRSMRWDGNGDNGCDSVRPLSTDVVRRPFDALPPEVSAKLAVAGMSGWALTEKFDPGQFIVWTAYPKETGNFCLGPRKAGVDRLVIFHKASHSVDIVSGP